MSDIRLPRTTGRIFHGWYIVAVVILAGLLLPGFQSFGFGFFFKPLSEELGINRSLVSGALAVRAAIAALLAIPLGFAVDRYGPRSIMVLGVLFAGGARIALGRVTNLWQFYLVFGLGAALGDVATGPNVTSTVVAKWFVRLRGRAIALTTTGIPLAGVIITPLVFFLIEEYGWRWALGAFGLLVWLLLLAPSFLIMRRMPEDMGLLPDGLSQEAPSVGSEGSNQRVVDERNWTVREALRTPTLWFLVASLSLSSMVMNATQLHQVPYMSDKGFSPAVAAAVVTTLGVTSLLAKFIWGFLTDLYPFRYLMAICWTLIAVALVLLVTGSTTNILLLYGALTGIARAQGVWLGISYPTYYGRRFLGGLRGILAPFNLIASSGGALLPGLIYDITGSYRPAFLLLAALSLMAAILGLLARPPRVPEPATGEPVPTEATSQAGVESGTQPGSG